MANRLHPLLETKPAMMTVLQNRYSFPEYPWSVSIKMSPERCLWLIPGQSGNNPWAETFNPVKKYLQKLALATNGIEIYSGREARTCPVACPRCMCVPGYVLDCVLRCPTPCPACPLTCPATRPANLSWIVKVALLLAHHE